jgi:hypothetical protein
MSPFANDNPACGTGSIAPSNKAGTLPTERTVTVQNLGL